MKKLQIGDHIILNNGDKGVVNFANETGYEATMESSGKYHHLLPSGAYVGFGVDNPLSINWIFTMNKESYDTVKHYDSLRKEGYNFTPDELYDWDAHSRVLEKQE